MKAREIGTVFGIVVILAMFFLNRGCGAKPDANPAIRAAVERQEGYFADGREAARDLFHGGARQMTEANALAVGKQRALNKGLTGKEAEEYASSFATAYRNEFRRLKD